MLGEFLKYVAALGGRTGRPHWEAALGGHLGRTHDAPPGPEIIWRGMRRIFDFALAWETRAENAKPKIGSGYV